MRSWLIASFFLATGLTFQCFASDFSKKCKQWPPKEGQVLKYKVFSNSKSQFSKEDAPPEWPSDLCPERLFPIRKLYRGSYMLDDTTIVHRYYNGMGGATFVESLNLYKERNTCDLSATCEHPEVIRVPAGIFQTCKGYYVDAWGKSNVEVWVAPNLPMDGVVRAIWHNPNAHDCVVRFDLVSHPVLQ